MRVLAAVLVLAAGQADAPPAASPAAAEQAGSAEREAQAPAPGPGAAGEAPAAGPRRPVAAPAPPTTAPAAAERVQVAAAARRFAEALVARRASDLASLCAPSFSFDGRVASGADAVRARWAEVLAARGDSPDALLDLAVAPAADAQARLGKPPKRVAALLGPGAWVAVADISGRPVVIVFARHGGALVATGIHG